MLFGVTKVTLDIPAYIISADNLHHGKLEMISHEKHILPFFISGDNKTDLSQLIQPDHQRFGFYRTTLGARGIGSRLQGPSLLALGILGSGELSPLYVNRPIVFGLGDIGIALLVAAVYYRFIQITAEIANFRLGSLTAFTGMYFYDVVETVLPARAGTQDKSGGIKLLFSKQHSDAELLLDQFT
jgi:hypothetical protein